MPRTRRRPRSTGMGQQLRIEGDEAVTLATELAALTGESVQVAVLRALRAEVEQRRERQMELDRLMSVTEAFRLSLAEPLPSSDHDWLYDDAGLPL